MREESTEMRKESTEFHEKKSEVRAYGVFLLSISKLKPLALNFSARRLKVNRD